VQQRRGIWYGVTAYVIWGLSPIFWNAIEDVPALELLAHRVLWSIPLLLLVIAVRHRWSILRHAYASRRTVVVAAVSGILVGINWGVFVWAATSGHIVDASLGYYINPLVSVALGVVVLREHLTIGARIAVGIAAVGVAVMAISIGVVPWVSLTLAFAFGFYGLMKKRPDAAPPIEGLLGETVTVAVPLAVVVVLLTANGDSSFGTTTTTSVLLALGGAVTVVPLLLFGGAAQRIPLSMVGLLQYLTPTIQLIIGVTLYDETMSGGRVFGFVMVWIALAVYTADSLRNARRARMVAGPVGS